MLEMSKLYVCPYCGVEEQLRNYLIKKKDGYSKYVICPLCKERMYINTLFAEFTPDEWGEWIYLNIRLFNSPRFKFYDKVHWEMLWANLSNMHTIEIGFKRGFFNAKREWGNYDAKGRLNELKLKYKMIKEKNLTWKEKKNRGLILEAYIK